jgi:hypothetical protein
MPIAEVRRLADVPTHYRRHHRPWAEDERRSRAGAPSL